MRRSARPASSPHRHPPWALGLSHNPSRGTAMRVLRHRWTGQGNGEAKHGIPAQKAHGRLGSLARCLCYPLWQSFKLPNSIWKVRGPPSCRD